MDGTLSCIYNHERSNLKFEPTISRFEKFCHLFSENKKQRSKGPIFLGFYFQYIYKKVKLQFLYFLVLCCMMNGLLIHDNKDILVDRMNVNENLNIFYLLYY